MTRCLFGPLLAPFLAALTYAQTAYDLAGKYKKLETYEVRPGILVTATFGTDGQACQMTIQKNHHVAQDSIDLRSTISGTLKDNLVNELVPQGERGAEAKDERFLGSIEGNMYQTEISYENVSVEEVGVHSNACEPGTVLIIIRWKNRGCTFPKNAENPNDAVPPSTLPK